MAIAYYIPQSHHEQSSGNTSTSSETSSANSSTSSITIPINQGSTGNSNTCWELFARVFCFALRFCHQSPSQGVLRITFECQTTNQSSSTTTSENTTNKFKN